MRLCGAVLCEIMRLVCCVMWNYAFVCAVLCEIMLLYGAVSCEGMRLCVLSHVILCVYAVLCYVNSCVYACCIMRKYAFVRLYCAVLAH